jgi:hypothetical protein
MDPFFAGLGAVIAGTFVIGKVVSSRRARQREEVLASLGFRRVDASEAFPAGSTTGCDLFDLSQTHGVYGPVALGSTARGDTAIFRFSTGGSRTVPFTVVGFRVARSVADFTVRHAQFGDQWVRKDAQPRQLATVHIGLGGIQVDKVGTPKSPVAFDDDPEFAKNWLVRSTNPEATRAALTSAARERLRAANDSALHVEKGGEWIFYYRRGIATAPGKYPALLDEAAQFVSLLELRS